ncbi:hypothetical protein [Hymenobacter bucti]|uniref:Outer membrane protein beta-barrel domain-containing protein n=1 Tax=Hymenobacter bucti TaxID=1844114 RepID=A0ABW4QNB0_9BACT
MQKLLITAALSLIGATSYAQTIIKAGTVQLGGSVGYSQQSNDNSYNYYTGTSYLNTTQHAVYKSFSINPMAGYFVADNLAIGLSVAQNNSKTAYSYDSPDIAGGDQRNSQLNLGAFVQYYRLFTDHFGLVGTLNAGYTHGTSTSTYASGGSRGTSNGFSAALTPSIVFFPVPKFSIGASVGNVGYSHYTSKIESDNNVLDSGTSNGSSFGAGFGISYLTFSGTYYFGR